MKIWFEEGGGGLQKDFYWRGVSIFRGGVGNISKKGGLTRKGWRTRAVVTLKETIGCL